jgi:L-amino acid N-acyltransferase YncA
MLAEHAAAVLAIYQAGIDEGNATFETHVPAWEQLTAAKLADHRYVARRGVDVLGWVAVSAVSDRCVYGGVVEHSVYVHPGTRGQGIGRRLLDTLISSTEAAGIWTIQSGIFPENTASAGDIDRVLAASERSALVTVTPYTTDGSAEIAGDSTDLVLARHDGRLHVFHRDPDDHGTLLSGTPGGKDVHDTLADLLA